MGYDVYGLSEHAVKMMAETDTSPAGIDLPGWFDRMAREGAYFRNSIHRWPPLVNYMHSVAPALVDASEPWFENGGHGLDASRAAELADLLQKEIESGCTHEYEVKFYYRQPPNKHAPRLDKLLRGSLPPGVEATAPSQDYPFSVENVGNFVRFLRKCGGFEIH